MDKLLSFQEKKITNFFSIVQGSAREKTYTLLSIRGITLLIRAKNYESGVSITSPLKTITDPLKEIEMVKTDPKKVPSQIFFLIVPLGTIAQLFTKKKIFHFTIPLRYARVGLRKGFLKIKSGTR